MSSCYTLAVRNRKYFVQTSCTLQTFSPTWYRP